MVVSQLSPSLGSVAGQFGCDEHNTEFAQSERPELLPPSPASPPAPALPQVPPLPAFPPDLLAEEDLNALKKKLERDYVLFHLERLAGDTRALSRLLGISRKQFYRRCRALGIRLRKSTSP